MIRGAGIAFHADASEVIAAVGGNADQARTCGLGPGLTHSDIRLTLLLLVIPSAQKACSGTLLSRWFEHWNAGN
jgi:hypothetical protein